MLRAVLEFPVIRNFTGLLSGISTEGRKVSVVFISGCDTGLGYSLALHTHSLGVKVLAGCLDINSPGASALRKKNEDSIRVLPLDVTKQHSVENARRLTEDFLTNSGLELTALVNNAGVMVFGESEWQTPDLVRLQMEVNVIGAMLLTNHMLPLLRKSKGRVINVGSHCGLAALPALSVYAATKAALAAWSDGLRVEQAKYRVKVVLFLPGSFVLQSNLVSRQKQYAEQMEAAMSQEKKQFYGDYFKRFNEYLAMFCSPRPLQSVHDDGLYKTFEKALFSPYPATRYEYGPLSYRIYHFLFRWVPASWRDRLVVKMASLPSWIPTEESDKIK